VRRPVGVLAVQGGFAAHARALREIGHDTREVRRPADLDAIGGLVLPGGESTTQLRLLRALDLDRPLSAFIASGRPVLGTCAGLILLASRVISPAQASLGFLDVTVSRNAYGSQRDSFEGVADDGRTILVFIRAPRIVGVGPEVDVLATFRGEAILVRHGNVMGAAFHPELGPDRGVYRVMFGSPLGSALPATSTPA
jgi:pyridoxal 5'-phosphate synthase pdxT subunit